MSSLRPENHGYQVLLYYKFTKVNAPALHRDDHEKTCRELGLKGRIYIASEGLNGSVAGTPESILRYQQYVESFPEFAGIQWKSSFVDTVPFARLKVKLRPHLVNFGSASLVEVQDNAPHLSPKEFREALENPSEPYLLIDVRNQYESDVGYFEGAMRPALDSFSKFPQWVDETLAPHRDQKILMYCTGGIRCEKFSAYMKDKGFQKMYQLDGGILNYLEKEGPSHWRGRCFVFDDRLAAEVQGAPKSDLSRCVHCSESEDRFVNCSNMECNDLFIVCDACAQRFQGACSEECLNSPGRRPFDLSTFRIPYRRKHEVLGLSK